MLYLHKTNEVDTKDSVLEGKDRHSRHIMFKHPEKIDEIKLTQILKDIYDKS